MSEVNFSVKYGSRIFGDKTVFTLGYLPSKIWHRDRQIDEITRILSDMEQNVTPRNILGVGHFGTGKTVTVQHVCQQFPAVSAIYVNCNENNTTTRILRSAISRLRGEPEKIGLPGDVYFDRFKESVQQKRFLILTLDEFDKLVDRRDSDYEQLLYFLSRSVLNVTTILLTNRSDLETHLMTNLDSRVKDTFRWDRIEFEDYNSVELADILRDRCKVGLHLGTCEEGTIQFIAALAFKSSTGARGLVQITRRAGEVAEKKEESKISEEDVREALTSLSHEEDLRTVQTLSPLMQAMLQQIMTNSLSYEWFKKATAKYGIGSSYQSYMVLLKQLQTVGIIVTVKRGRGRGRGIDTQYIINPHMADIIKASLQHLELPEDTHPPTARNVTGNQP